MYTYDDAGNILTVTRHSASGTNGYAVYNPFCYRGYYRDSETGFYYLQSRYYDPQVGRFLNADGFVSTGQGLLGNNMFAYCGNNPVNRKDSTGQFWLIALAVTAVVAVCTVSLSGCSSQPTSDVGAAPNYKEIGSSNGNRNNNPNCYSYAIGYYDRSYDPGDFSNSPQSLNVNDVAKAVESDLQALNRGCRRIDSYNSPINSDEYRIALRVSEPKYVITPYGMSLDWDYHFMVQTSSGCWAEKHGPGGATVYHKSGNPNTISWDCGNVKGYYTSEIVYFAITN